MRLPAEGCSLLEGLALATIAPEVSGLCFARRHCSRCFSFGCHGAVGSCCCFVEVRA